MKTVAAKLYEGMFLVDSALAASDWQGVNDSIRSILEKAGAEIVSINKWDERKLAYDIMGKSRGTFILTYFRVDGPRVSEIERAVQLSENIMRVLILDVEDLGEQYITKKTPVVVAQSRPSEDVRQSPDDIGVEKEAQPQETGRQDTEETDLPAEDEKDGQQ